MHSFFLSGRVIRRFVPISKILKPVLNECVTPVTCHWSLALILRDEDELMLVFQVIDWSVLPLFIWSVLLSVCPILKTFTKFAEIATTRKDVGPCVESLVCCQPLTAKEISTIWTSVQVILHSYSSGKWIVREKLYEKRMLRERHPRMSAACCLMLIRMRWYNMLSFEAVLGIMYLASDTD